jgi:hypothetical protein
LCDDLTTVIIGGKKFDIQQFKAAMDECGRRLGKEITKDMRREVHDAIPEWFGGAKPEYQDLVEMCKSMFNTLDDDYVTEWEAEEHPELLYKGQPWLFWLFGPGPAGVPAPVEVPAPGPEMPPIFDPVFLPA